MIDRVETRFDLRPQRLISDTACGSAPTLGWLVEDKATEPHVRAWNKSERHDDSLSKKDFQWDEQANEYRCLAGKVLRSRRRQLKKTAHCHDKRQHHHLSCTLKENAGRTSPTR